MARLRALAGNAALVAALVALLVVAALILSRTPDGAAVDVCRMAYRQARTAADSAAVDRQRPVVSRAQAAVAVDCRTLRMGGRLDTR